jgi:hypothetical protein
MQAQHQRQRQQQCRVIRLTSLQEALATALHHSQPQQDRQQQQHQQQ